MYLLPLRDTVSRRYMPFFTTHLVRPYLQDSPLFTRSNQTHPVCSSSDLLHSSTIPRSHARARQSGLFGERRCDGEQRQPSRLLSPLSHYPLQSGRLLRLLPAPLSASFVAIPFRQAVYFFPLRFPHLLPLSPSVRPPPHHTSLSVLCRYPIRSVRSVSLLSFSVPFAAIPSIQFTPYLPCRRFRPICRYPFRSGHAVPRVPLFAAPFAAIPLSQLGVMSSCSRVSSILRPSPILNSRSLAAVPGLAG
ncbi:hypothetical protein B0G52_101554 [Cohnella sp. SGD-V74]|nr:hypothetical protein B0G52_101554 [Cohnella sp. SGD-V74]